MLVSPQRTDRPWQGRVEQSSEVKKTAYDPQCYLCPGNERAGGKKNPVYKNTFVFDNDFSALSRERENNKTNIKDLIISESESGICRVVCFSPRHDLTLAEMDFDDVKTVVDTWVQEFKILGDREEINYVQFFENKGEIMGCSNPHPHSQIWATSAIPVEPLKETIHQKDFLEKKNKCLLCEYITLEMESNERVITGNDDFIVLVPFWAVWPFETLIISKRHIKNISEFSEKEKKSFAGILKEITSIYDKVFDVSFPYSAGIHQSPTDGAEHPEWHFHYHFYPPLLRSAEIKKFMVGFEMLANPQKDFTAETGTVILKQIVKNYFTKEGSNELHVQKGK